MTKLLITPILFQYNFLTELTNEAASLLSLNLSDEKRQQQFRLSIFLNFNRYLIDSFLFLPTLEAEKILAALTPAIRAADEIKTLSILNSKLEFFYELRSDFLNIIKSLKK